MRLQVGFFSMPLLQLFEHSAALARAVKTAYWNMIHGKESNS